MTPERVTTRLGPLPGDWSVKPLGEVTEKTASPIEVQPRGLYREIGIRSHGKGVFHKEPVKGETLGAKRVFRVVPERLVFNIVFAWEGAVAVTSKHEEGMIASHRFPMFGPNEKRLIDVEFLRRFFETEQGVRLLGDASPGGAGRNRTLNQKFAAEIPVPVPPLGEQKKIAAILYSVDEAIKATQAVFDQLQVVRNALMTELFNRGVPGRHTRYRKSDIGEVPADWDVARVGELLEETAYGTSAKCEPKGEGLPVLRIPNVVNERVTTDDLKFACLPPAEVQRYMLRQGDLLVIRTNGNPNYVGRSAVMPDLPGSWLYASYLIRLRPNRARISSLFLHEALRSERARETMRGAIRTSAGNYNLNTQGIANTIVPVPPPSEQVEIVSAAHLLEGRLAAEGELVAGLRATKSALMSVLLTGEVRVKPDEEAA
jgi:type I restriction enzyme S subunit